MTCPRVSQLSMVSVAVAIANSGSLGPEKTKRVFFALEQPALPPHITPVVG